MKIMKVIKRNGEIQEVSFDKVIRRIKKMAEIEPVCNKIDPTLIAQQVCSQIYDEVKTSELDDLAAQICISLVTKHYQYGDIAKRIIISNNHKNTLPTFSETIYKINSGKIALLSPQV